MSQEPKYRRILLKLSGEALMGRRAFGIEPAVLADVGRQIQELYALGVDIAIVVGGGNFFRGISQTAQSMDRATADHIGMLATVMNSLALRDACRCVDVPARVLSAIAMGPIAEANAPQKARQTLDRRTVVIFAAGTGHPFFSTDTAAALRAAEISADVLIKATKVDGIFTADPMVDSHAKKIETCTFQEVLAQNLRVMDATAVSLCMENRIPILVLNMTQGDGIRQAVLGKKVGSIVKES